MAVTSPNGSGGSESSNSHLYSKAMTGESPIPAVKGDAPHVECPPMQQSTMEKHDSSTV